MFKKLNAISIGIILATVITAIIHLALAPVLLRDPAFQALGFLFILNGLGYLTLLVAFFLPQPFFRRYHNLVRWLLAGFAAATIFGWLVLNRDFSDPLGVISKLSEVILIVLLVLDRPKS